MRSKPVGVSSVSGGVVAARRSSSMPSHHLEPLGMDPVAGVTNPGAHAATDDHHFDRYEEDGCGDMKHVPLPVEESGDG